jgi:DnaJ homolog subfamily C member 28
MDSKDWRKSRERDKLPKEEDVSAVRKFYGRRFEDYVSEQIREAEARGEFDNLQGAGKPLSFLDDTSTGDKRVAYHLLKSNGYAPHELELAREIRNERERIEARLAKVRHQGSQLRNRRVPPFASEKRAYNAAVEKAATEYERALRELNRKILTLNVSAPVPLHQPPLPVEQLVQQFRDECPLFL